MPRRGEKHVLMLSGWWYVSLFWNSLTAIVQNDSVLETYCMQTVQLHVSILEEAAKNSSSSRIEAPFLFAKNTQNFRFFAKRNFDFRSRTAKRVLFLLQKFCNLQWRKKKNNRHLGNKKTKKMGGDFFLKLNGKKHPKKWDAKQNSQKLWKLQKAPKPNDVFMAWVNYFEGSKILTCCFSFSVSMW